MLFQLFELSSGFSLKWQKADDSANTSILGNDSGQHAMAFPDLGAGNLSDGWSPMTQLSTIGPETRGLYSWPGVL